MFLAAPLQAQFQMPDAKEMSGIPRPVDDLPDGTVSIRVIRGQLSNNLVGEEVALEGGGQTRTATTDDTGRAEFTGFAAGTPVTASTDVDGERLESPPFPFPGKGGIRMMLVATDKAAAAKPAVAGEVTIGGQSRIVIEPGDEVVSVYYLLTIHNAGSSPVDLREPFTFEMPAGAVGTTVLEGSTPQASASGTRILVKGPFAPGNTFVQAACELPVTSGTLEIAARFPAKFEQLEVVVKRLGDTKLSSPAITSYHDLTANGAPYIGGTGRAVPANQEIELVLSGVPHHSATPRIMALFLAVTIVLAGVWGSTRPTEAAPTRAAERKRLLARREKLFADLVRLENDARTGRVERGKYAARREELISSLELVYGALEESEPPASGDDAPGVHRGRSAQVTSEGGATANA